MRKVIYGVGASLDGCIARLDGSLDFFPPEALELFHGAFLQVH